MSNKYSVTVNWNNYDMSQSAKARIEQILKPIYWNIENFPLPEDWKDFGGDIEVEGVQERGGDRVVVKAEKHIITDVVDHFSKSGEFRELRSITIEASKEVINHFNQYIDKHDIAQYERYGQPEVFELKSYVKKYA